jgi:hypothetical protein
LIQDIKKISTQVRGAPGCLSIVIIAKIPADYNRLVKKLLN